MAENESSTYFGAELRRLRTQAGLSLAVLAERVHYSKSYLSKVENGVKSPSADFARSCDACLGADGALAGLVTAPPREIRLAVPAVPVRPPQPSPPPQFVAGVPMAPGISMGPGMSLSPEAAFAGTAFGGTAPFAIPAGAHPNRGTDQRNRPADAWAPILADLTVPSARLAEQSWQAVLDSFTAMLEQVRRLGQLVGPAALTPVLLAGMRALYQITPAQPSAQGRAALRLAARFADYTGWMAQEHGDDTAALRWTEHAVALADAAHDAEMVAYAYVRRALVTLYRHDAAGTVALARHVRKLDCGPRVRGLAAQREAQGHALAGDADSYERSIEDAAVLFDQARAESAARVPLGTSHVGNPIQLARGWCLHDLGRSDEAVAILRDELERTPTHAGRARARIGARLSLALASTRRIAEACEVARPVLDLQPSIDSATIRSDLRRLVRVLNRWHADPVVREFMPRLSAALRPPLPPA